MKFPVPSRKIKSVSFPCQYSATRGARGNRRQFIEMAQAVAVCSLCLIVAFVSVSLCYSQGSTKHLKDIVLGRCWDFQRQKAHDVSTKNCSKIWETFYTAFAYKDPCNTTFADYASYFDEIGMDIIKPNKVRKGLILSVTYICIPRSEDWSFLINNC